MLIAVLSGSGDAATIAFNNTITPYAELFGMATMDLGNAANLGGALGRTMSPVAGAAIVCASIAKVNPMEIAKRNAPGMILAAIALIILSSI
jgi:DcuC family C4-dicarboxylate transporter